MKYSDKRGNVVEVSQEHINTAIKIKIELQKSSPSQKCSWSQHKKMMEIEGFTDSDTNENYRQMIKKAQKKSGELPELKKYVEMVTENKLKSIREEIGEIYLEKRDNQIILRELNKIKRELSDNIIFFDEVSKGIKDISFKEDFEKLLPLEPTKNSMIVSMSDWHIGLKTDEFDYSIAINRTNEYARKILHYAKTFNINEVHVMGIGDLVNGAYMRPTQVAENEFTYSEQIVKATEIIFMFLQTLSSELNVVYLGAILGNHSRMYDKGKVLQDDSAENIIDSTVKSFIKMSNNKRITINDRKNDNFSISVNINNVDIKAVHGDLISKKSNEKLQKFISSDKIFYNVLLYGHFHHTSYVEENHGRLALGSGCLQGNTDYSKQLGYDSIASQTIVILEGETVIPIRVVLN